MTRAWTAIAVCLTLVSAGCVHRPRHGLLLRGDWSLEINRVPWIGSRAVSQEDCTEPCLTGQTAAGGTSGPIGRACGGYHGAGCVGKPEGLSRYPRLFPVPTRPVFPSDAPPPAESRERGIEAGEPGPSPTTIPPAPQPELPEPPTPNSRETGRSTVPRQLRTAARGNRWIFAGSRKPSAAADGREATR